MKKIISTSITALLLTAAGASADTYFFSGTGTTDFDNVSNWYKITSKSSPWSKWGIPQDKECPLYTDSYTGEKLNNSYTYANATQMPTANDDIVFGIYYFAEQDTTSNTKIPALKNSVTVKNFLFRTHKSPNFVLGNSDESAAGSEFILKTSEDLFDVYNNVSYFTIDADAKQSAFRMQIGGRINSASDNKKYTYFGNANRGFDSIEAGSVVANIHYNFFAKKLIVSGDFTYGSKLTNENHTSSFNFIDLKDGEVAVSIGGKLSKSENYKINLDFTNANLGEGETYTLIGAGSVEGFDQADYTKDFNLIGLDAAAIKSLAWSGNSLVLTTAVPEPAAIAAVLGAIALGFAAYRRRK